MNRRIFAILAALLLTALVTTGANASDRTKAIAVDDDGNIFVTGKTTCIVEEGSTVSHSDLTTLAYDSQGQLIWEARYRYNGTEHGNSSDGSHWSVAPSGFVVNADGTITVGGTSFFRHPDFHDGRDPDCVVIRYDAEGRELGVVRIPWCTAHRFLSDGGDGFYLFDYDETGSDSGILYRLDAEGNILWTKDHGNSTQDVVVKADGSTVLLRREGLTRLSGNGSVLWEYRLSAHCGSAIAAAFDDEGSTYASFRCGVLRMDDSGELIWRVKLEDRRIFDLHADSEGGLIGAGHLINEDARPPYVVTRFVGDGEIDWEATFGKTIDIDIPATSILDPTGNAILTGSTFVRDGSNYSWQLGTGKVDVNGNLLWFQTFQAGNYRTTEPVDIAVDADDNIFIGVAANLDGGLRAVKYDPDGEELLEIHYESPDDCLPDEDDDEGCGCW